MAHVIPFPEPDHFIGAVAANVRAEAARRGLNQTGLAAILGIDQGNVSRRWRGQRAFSLEDLGKIAAAFGITPAVLVELPRLDSNQKPSGYWYETSRPAEPQGAEVVSLDDARARRRSDRHEAVSA